MLGAYPLVDARDIVDRESEREIERESFLIYIFKKDIEKVKERKRERLIFSITN